MNEKIKTAIDAPFNHSEIKSYDGNVKIKSVDQSGSYHVVAFELDTLPLPKVVSKARTEDHRNTDKVVYIDAVSTPDIWADLLKHCEWPTSISEMTEEQVIINGVEFSGTDYFIRWETEEEMKRERKLLDRYQEERKRLEKKEQEKSQAEFLDGLKQHGVRM